MKYSKRCDIKFIRRLISCLKMRIEYACSLLLNGRNTLIAIWYESRYNNFSYFNCQFRMIKGMTPSEYRKKYAVTYGADFF